LCEQRKSAGKVRWTKKKSVNDEHDKIIQYFQHFLSVFGILEVDIETWRRWKTGSSGLPDFFLVQTYQNGKKLPNDHKLDQKAVKYTKWP
jgi:hypothetical protein